MLTDKSSRIAVLGLLAGFGWFGVSVAGFCGENPNLNHKTPARNENLRAMPAKILTASWYSRESLIKEGTWKDGKERMMANGQKLMINKILVLLGSTPSGRFSLLRIEKTEEAFRSQLAIALAKDLLPHVSTYPKGHLARLRILIKGLQK